MNPIVQPQSDEQIGHIHQIVKDMLLVYTTKIYSLLLKENNLSTIVLISLSEGPKWKHDLLIQDFSHQLHIVL
jgi:hypothetical protein